jgi:peroxiredoxin-like protein
MSETTQTHLFELRGVWTGGLGGGGCLEAGQLAVNLAVPKALGGPGGATNPEELLLGAAASCFLITLAATVRRFGLEPEALEVASVGSFAFDGRRLTLTGIEHRPRVRLKGGDPTKLREAYDAAEAGCMVSQALRVPVKVRV